MTFKATYKTTKTEQQIASGDYNTSSVNYSNSFALNRPGIYCLTLEVKDESSATEDTLAYEVLPSSGPSKEEAAEQKTESPEDARTAEETALEETKSLEMQPKTKKPTTITKPSVVEKTVASEATTTVASQKTKTAEEQVTQKQPVTNTEPVKGDITLTVSEIKEPVYARQKVTVNAAIKNDSQTNITGCKLKFYIDSKPYGSPKTFVLQVGETRNVDISFTSSKMGASALKWELVAPENFVIDSAPENNVVERVDKRVA